MIRSGYAMKQLDDDASASKKIGHVIRENRAKEETK